MTCSRAKPLQDQKLGRFFVTVSEHTQDGKQVRAMLDFIDDDQSGEWFESESWGREAFEVRGIFEVEVIQGFVARIITRRRQTDGPTWSCPIGAVQSKPRPWPPGTDRSLAA